MDKRYSEKIIERYRNYMKKYGVILSTSQSESDLESFCTVFLSFAIAEQEEKAEIKSKEAKQTCF